MVPALSQAVQAANVTVYPGARGSAVRQVEANLETLGYYRGQIDGVYGPQLGAAIRRFQADHRLMVDGVVGPQTWAAMTHTLSTHPSGSVILTSVLTTELQEGSSGAAVAHLQALLDDHGANLAQDGKFGPLTLAAVETFQRDNGLPADGIVGAETWAALERTATSSQASPTFASAPPGMLVEGDHGPAVAHLQALLDEHGFHLAQDGIFGPETLAAVDAFQRNSGLAVDGIVGPATLGALNKVVLMSSRTPAAGPGYLQMGSTGQEVLIIQRELTSLGYNTYGEDGIFGPDTRAAVMSFQSHEGLPANGIVGPQTLDALQRALSTDRGAPTTPSYNTSLGNAIAGFAETLVGDRYEWGGVSPATGFDCSGLVMYVYAHFGISLPRTSYAQWDVGTPVSYSELEPGDLVFFSTTGPGASHVGIYVGGGRFVAADTYATGVNLDYFSSYWLSHFLGAKRPGGV